MASAGCYRVCLSDARARMGARLPWGERGRVQAATHGATGGATRAWYSMGIAMAQVEAQPVTSWHSCDCAERSSRV